MARPRLPHAPPIPSAQPGASRRPDASWPLGAFHMRTRPFARTTLLALLVTVAVAVGGLPAPPTEAAGLGLPTAAASGTATPAAATGTATPAAATSTAVATATPTAGVLLVPI